MKISLFFLSAICSGSSFVSGFVVAPSAFGAARRQQENGPLFAEVTVALIKELREATGVGIMDCKKALIEADGDMEAANEYLRKKGFATANKKASRTAAEGKIVVAQNDDKIVMVEVNCETDFVAKDSTFSVFVDKVAQVALDMEGDSVDTLMSSKAATDSDLTLEDERQALVAKIGENIQVRRSTSRTGNTLGSYVHMNRIGVLVEIEGGSSDLATEVAMHVTAMNPPFAVPEEVPEDVLNKEREILTEQALATGKPAAIVEKMVEGRIRKYLEENCLVSQTHVKVTDKTVGQLLEDGGAKMVGFSRFLVGEEETKKKEEEA